MTESNMGRRLWRAAVTVAVSIGTLAATTGSGGATGIAAAADPAPAEVRLNEIQVVGSHNSYHLAASPEETAVRRSFIGDADDLMQYAHVPLDQQFEEQKVRQIELDIFRDSEGGLYSNPLLRTVAGHGPYDAAMAEPGTKVLHVQDVDYRSNCLSLVACLQTVESWSDANPHHLPIAILLELKDEELVLGDFEFATPEPWTAAAMDDLDDEIRSVVGEDDMITPDDVRGDAATLEAAILDTGWPTLEESRGQVMFLMDNEGGARTSYLTGHPTLEDRVLFTSAAPGNADAGFVKVNDSRGNVARIQELVEDGYVVRTRSDAETVEAREGDTTARDAAFTSGAQWVSTDYPVPEYAEPFGTGFVVEIPGGTVARCNPINGPEGCVSADLEVPPAPGEGAYVRRLYQVFLGRTPSATDEAYWADRIERGASSRTSVARSLARGAEGNRGAWVRAVSQEILGRPTDASARDYWAGRLAGGWPLDKVRIAMVASNEVYARGGGTNAGWVDELFESVLRRPADPGALAYFTARLDRGDTRSVIARQVVGSIEARRYRARGIGTALLERSVTATEVTAWAELLRRTRDDRDLAVAIVATDEYHG